MPSGGDPIMAQSVVPPDEMSSEDGDSSPRYDPNAGRLGNALTRRRVAAIAGGAVLFGAAGWVTRSPPVQDVPGWRTAASLPAARGEMKAAVLDGRIYVPGGLTGLGTSTARMDVYDVTRDAWVTAASMPTGLNHHGTAALGDRIYVVGGSEAFGDPPGTFAYAYDPDADAWENLPALPDGRWGHELLALDGALYVLGGVPDADEALDTFVYDPEAAAWERGAPMPTVREHVAAAAVDDELVVVGGRWNGDNTGVVESYDPGRDEWRALADLPTPRSGFGAAVANGALHAIGGEDPATVGGWTTNAHERYDPAADAWTSAPEAPLPVHGNAVLAVEDRVYVIGGAWRQGAWSVTSWSDRTFVFEPNRA